MVDSIQTQNYKQFWTVGSGSSGLLLNGQLDDIHTFRQININQFFGNSSQISQLEIDGMMGFYLNSKGEVYKFGECEYDEKNKPIVNPIPCKMSSFKTPVIKISCGWSHAMFVDQNIISFQHIVIKKEQHKIYGVGSNKFGELGLNVSKKIVKDIEEIYFSSQLSEDLLQHEIYDIKCAFRQSFIITKSQENSQIKFRFHCTGQNKSFELGGFKDEPVLYNFKENSQILEVVGSIKKFICGYKFGCILNYENKLFGWGDNKYGQLTGDENKYEKIIQIADDVLEFSAGWNHLLILKSIDLINNI